MATGTDQASQLDAIYALANSNLRAFCAVYLPHHFRLPEQELLDARKFGWDLKPGWGEPQIKIADALSNFVRRKQEFSTTKNIVLEVFRGAGKSTIGVVGLILWMACTRRRKNILLISDTATQAVDHLASLIDELTQNELLAKKFGVLYSEERDSKTERKRQNDITLSNGIRIFARGAGQRLRGTKWKAARPDLVVLDDPQGEAHAESLDRMEKLNRWVNRVVIPMGASNCLFVVIATPIRNNDVIDNFKKKPGTYHLNLPAEKNGKATDPYRFPLTRLRHLQGEMGPTAYEQEMQLKPQGDNQRSFERHWFGAWPVTPVAEEGPGFIGWDPAAKAKETNDPTGIVVGRLVNNRLVVFRAVQQRMRIEMQAEVVAMLAKKYECRYLAVETISAQEWALGYLKQQLEKVNWTLDVVQQEHNKDKKIFIESTLQAAAFRGDIKMVENKETEKLLDELEAFPTGSHDDLCDALADCYLAYCYFSRRTSNMTGMEKAAKFIAGVKRFDYAKVATK